MFWYKAWRESQLRFLVMAAALAILCAYAVLAPPTQWYGHPLNYAGGVYRMVYYGRAKGLFCIFLPFLAMGGLLRERGRRTELFTLALPVSRVRLTGAFIAVGFTQLIALSFLPVVLLPTLSRLVGHSYPLLETVQFMALWIGYGSPFFAVAVMLSVTLGGEFVAPGVAFLLLLFYGVIVDIAGDSGFHITSLIANMSGIGTVHAGLIGVTTLTGFPWESLLISLATAIALVTIAVQLARRQDF